MTMPRYISVDAADAAQPVEIHLVQRRNFDVRFAGERARRAEATASRKLQYATVF